MDLASAKILITQAHLVRFMGSEIVTLELAEYFGAAGADVVVATHSFGGVLREPFGRLPRVRVFELADPEFEHLLETWIPDLVWVHHSIIPGPVLERAAETAFVFHHMSATLPVEYSLAPDLEAALATVSTFISPSTREKHVATGLYDGIETARLQLFENPAPARFVGPERPGRPSAPGDRRALLIVSNHLPEELVAALPALRRHYDVTLVGSQTALGARPRLVEPALLARADAVITIGKTVQFALASGLPAYVYDHLGGPGWLDEGNFAAARYKGFSGSGYPKKTTADIVREVVDGFDGAARALPALRREHGSSFLLADRMAELLDFVHAERRVGEAPSPQRIRGHVSMQTAFGSYVREWIRRDADATNLGAALDLRPWSARLVDGTLRGVRSLGRFATLRRLARRVMGTREPRFPT